MTWKHLTATSLAVLVVALANPAPSRAAEEIDVHDAVQKAAGYLRSKRTGNSWQYQYDVPSHHVGLTALCTLALLAANVPNNDPAVVGGVKYVRDNAPTLLKSAYTNTYGISLTIVLLDFYYNSDPAVDSLIQQLTVQLIAGQNPKNGGWTYNCPPLTKELFDKWYKFLDSTQNKPLPDDADPGPVLGGIVDNSNTQFAILALWIGRRKGIPVTYPLLLAERRFRKSQQSGGGWNYGLESGGPQHETVAMTCAGLIALAFGYGAATENGVTIVRSGKASDANAPDDGEGSAPRKLDKDEQVARARKFLVARMQQIPPEKMEHMHYTLWSLERVCVLYAWKDVNGFDWYAWGARTLLKTQAQDGSWSGGDIQTGNVAATAFAVLFLMRADFTKDFILVRSGKLKDMVKKDRDSGTEAAGGTRPKDTTPNIAPPADHEAKRLRERVVSGGGRPQEEALKKLRDTPGKEYTNALVEAIQQTSGGLQSQLRDALAERFMRDDSSALKKYLTSNERELQMAAAWAAALKLRTEVVPEVIGLLGSTDDAVSTKAVEALKILSTGEDYGKSADQWKAWWERYKKANPARK